MRIDEVQLDIEPGHFVAKATRMLLSGAAGKQRFILDESKIEEVLP